MRITQDLLHKFANQTVKQRMRSELDLHAVYLTGSLLSETPLLGGTTDIDLVFVHKYQTPVSREVLPITSEISVDIIHKTIDDYDPHRKLRHDAFVGYPLTNNHILLYDSDHWLEFIQASVSAEFHRADNVLARVSNLSTAARDKWFSFAQSDSETHLTWLNHYLEIIELAANALSGLIGPPLTTRRFMRMFFQRTEDLGTEHIYEAFLYLMGLTEIDDEKYADWIEAYSEDLIFLSDSNTLPVHLSPCRHTYYLDAIQVLSKTDTPVLAAWPLLLTWLDIQHAAPQSTPGVAAWEALLETLALTQESSDEKINALDSFLDTIEELIEDWSNEHGYQI